MRYIDLTQTFTDKMPVYPGDPQSSLKQVAHIDKEGYNDHHISSVMHVGTHIDAPLHMVRGGKTIDEILPDALMGPGVLIDVRNMTIIDNTALKETSIKNGSIVLLYTDFGKLYRSKKYYKNYPYVTGIFAKKMVSLKVKMVGMDMLGPDLDAPWVAHKILLSKEVLILENLTNLDKLLNVKRFDIIALPAKLKADAAPVRVIAKVSNEN